MAKTKWRTQKARTLSLNRERFVSSKNREQFAILTKQKNANLLKVSVLFHEKKANSVRLSRREQLHSPHFRGETGIRTRDTLLTYTRFPGVPLQPLEHLSLAESLV